MSQVEQCPRVRLGPVLALGAALLLTVVSCNTVDRVVMAPPEIPGAKFVGSQECAQCHEALYKEFVRSASHARVQAKGPNALNMGCESCHGPGSLHIDSAGETRIASAARPGDTGMLASNRRAMILNPRRGADTCFECHLDKRGQFDLPSHHQVQEGRMSCGDCHDPHKGPATKGGGVALLSENESCLKCHQAQKGPHVFEHEAMREGCTTCHDPHGSVNAKLLTARNQNLCLKCHFQEIQGGKLRIGGVDHTSRVRQGTCWTAGCHEAIHGSQVSSSLRF